MLPSWRTSTAVLESEHQIPTKAWYNGFYGHFCCTSCSNKVAPNVQHKSLSSSPFGLFLPWPSSTVSFSSESLAGFSCLGRCGTTEEVLITVGGFFFFFLFYVKKHLWHLMYFVGCLFFCLSSLQKCLCVFKRRLHGSGEEDNRAGLVLDDILYLGSSHAEVPCSDWSHLTSTVGKKANAWVSIPILQTQYVTSLKEKVKTFFICILCPIASICSCNSNKLTHTHTNRTHNVLHHFLSRSQNLQHWWYKNVSLLVTGSGEMG